MDQTGQVVRGEVRGLLRRDVDAPYGVRYDPGSVVQAFTDVWADVDVAVVELSDLDRADSYRREAASGPATRMWEEALTRSDELFGTLLEQVEPGPTVHVHTPAPPRAAATPGVFAMPHGDARGRLDRAGITRRPAYLPPPAVAPPNVPPI